MGNKQHQQENKAGQTPRRAPPRGSGFNWPARLFLVLTLASISSAAPARFVPGQILIKPRRETAETDFDARVSAHGGWQRRSLHRLNVRVVNVPEERAEAVLAALRRDPAIEFAERDFVAEAAFLPNDTYVVSGAAWHLAKIQTPRAWDFTRGASNVIVAVLDSGINAAHPDLAGKILPGYDFVWDDSDPADDFGHGTAVAGIAAASGDNGLGVAGVAFGSRILPVKVMDASGNAAYSTLAQGIRYAVDRGARVINISIAGNAPSATLQEAINYAWSNNVIIVAAAGNNANSTPQFPAACENVLAVSATGADDTLASFSSFGGHIALAAPGENIWTTARDLASLYVNLRGTSAASPIVAGVAALVAAANTTLANTDIVSLLKQNADDLGVAGIDGSFGHGRVNAARAVAAAAGNPAEPPQPMPPSPPEVRLTSPLVGAQITLGTTLSVTASASADTAAGARLAKVEVFANGVTLASFDVAPFSVNWKPIAAGDYSLWAVATDNAGQGATSSAIAVRVVSNAVTGPLTAPLSLKTNGLGAVKPNLDGKVLVVGNTYKVRAVPCAGQVFAGWEGSTSTSSTLQFTMQPGLALVAKFVPNPFGPVKGSFAGLVYDTNGVAPASSGAFTLKGTGAGAFSGALTLGGVRHSMRGAFDLNGDATVTIPRYMAAPISVRLRADLARGTDRISGQVTDGNLSATLGGNRNVFSVLSNPAPQAGERLFVLEADNPGTNSAAGGSSKISAAGRASVRGHLGDGRKFSAANSLAKNGDYPFYLSLSQRSEVVVGWLNFPAGSATAAGGTVVWVRTGTNGFATTLEAAAAP